MLKPQDVLVSLKLAAHEHRTWTYEALATDLGLSPSATHAAVRRAAACGLLSSATHEPIRPALLEFLVHGLRYVFPAVIGRRVRGMPTGASAEPLARYLASTETSPLVWPYARGEARGESLAPLYETVPEAAARDPELYALLTVADGIRAGGARVRQVAAALIEELLRR
ncbi:MAG: hypothetical protein KF729_15520 [Sandaracinaceae bacterium]|nr:hypothetical protein [Sandaracinaceae bacterium]